MNPWKWVETPISAEPPKTINGHLLSKILVIQPTEFLHLMHKLPWRLPENSNDAADSANKVWCIHEQMPARE